jgi:hypothetical protein
MRAFLCACAVATGVFALLPSVAGSITGASVSGRVVTTGPQPQQGFQLFLVPADEPQPIRGATWAINTDTDGRFIAQDLEPGDYLLGLPLAQLGEDPTVVTPLPETIQFEFAGTVTAVPAMRISVGQNETVTGVEIIISITPPARTFDPPPPPNVHLHFVEDTNLDGQVSDGDSITALVQVLLQPWSNAYNTIELHTDAAGNGTFMNVPPGDYSLHIYWPGGFVHPRAPHEVPHLIRSIFRMNADGSITAPDKIPAFWPGSGQVPLVPADVVLGPLPDTVLLYPKDPRVGSVSTDTMAIALGVGSIDVGAALAQRKITAPGTGIHAPAAPGRSTLLALTLAVCLGCTGSVLIVSGRRARSCLETPVSARTGS